MCLDTATSKFIQKKRPLMPLRKKGVGCALAVVEFPGGFDLVGVARAGILYFGVRHFGPPSLSKALPLFTCKSMLAFGSDTPFKWVERAIEFVGQPGRRRCPCLLPTAKYAARAAAMPSSSTSMRAILLPGARPSAWLNSSQSMGCFAPVAAGSAAARLLLRRSAHLRWSACSRPLLDCSVNHASRQSAFMRTLRSHFFYNTQ